MLESARAMWQFGPAILLVAILCGCRGDDARRDGFEFVIGGPGYTAGRFHRPRGLVYDAEGDRLYVLDWSGRLQVLTGDGAFRASWAMPKMEKGKPESLCRRANGNLLVADTHYHQVLEFTPAGAEVSRFGSYGVAPGQFTYPVAITVDADDNIYVAEYGMEDRVQKFDPTGKFLLEWGKTGDAPGDFQRPSGLAVGPDRLIYVADAVNHRVQVFDLQGRLVRILGEPGDGPGQFTYPYDLDLRGDTLYVMEYGTQRVQKLTLRGECLGTFGRGGRGDGQFANPWKLATAPDGVYVSDTNNSRVVKIAF